MVVISPGSGQGMFLQLRIIKNEGCIAHHPCYYLKNCGKTHAQFKRSSRPTTQTCDHTMFKVLALTVALSNS